jgi:hypothetical protein
MKPRARNAANILTKKLTPNRGAILVVMDYTTGDFMYSTRNVATALAAKALRAIVEKLENAPESQLLPVEEASRPHGHASAAAPSQPDPPSLAKEKSRFLARGGFLN